jgi:hypothetical protein
VPLRACPSVREIRLSEALLGPALEFTYAAVPGPRDTAVSREARGQSCRFGPVAEIAPNERVIDLLGSDALRRCIARHTIETRSQSLAADPPQGRPEVRLVVREGLGRHAWDQVMQARNRQAKACPAGRDQLERAVERLSNLTEGADPLRACAGGKVFGLVDESDGSGQGEFDEGPGRVWGGRRWIDVEHTEGIVSVSTRSPGLMCRRATIGSLIKTCEYDACRTRRRRFLTAPLRSAAVPRCR